MRAIRIIGLLVVAGVGALFAHRAWGGDVMWWYIGIIVGWFVLRMIVSDTAEQTRRDSEYLARGGRRWTLRDFMPRRERDERECRCDDDWDCQH